MAARITYGELLGLRPKDANFLIEYSKDFDARRAAVVSGYEPDTGYHILKRPEVSDALGRILQGRLESSHIDAEWALMEAVDNHQIARAQGNISASNTALRMVMQHRKVDAFAAEKLEVATDRDLLERIRRGRARNAGIDDEIPDDEVSFF